MDVEIKIGNLRFVARLEDEAAPKTCQAFRSMLPLESQLVQARWSGEAAWIPMGELDLSPVTRTRPAIRRRASCCCIRAG